MSRSRLQPLARAVLRSQSDERLVSLSREGREPAFEEIVRRYRPGLVAFAAAYAPSERAEDVVQESFLSSWEALRTSTREIHLKPWLYTIVRNRALNARRDTRIHEPLSDEIDGVRQPAEIVLSKEELDRVVGAVAALPDGQREALVRSSLEGHTHEQIAASIGSTPGAVRQLIFRARASVREGVGLLIPLPLVRLLANVDPDAAAATAAAGGAAIAGTAGGASALSKATVIAVVGTIAAGSGVAIQRAADERGGGDSPETAIATGAGGDSKSGGGAERAASGEPGGGSDGAGGSSGAGGGEDEGESEREGSDDDGDGGEGGDDSGPSPSSGPGSGPGDDDPDGDDNSGPGSDNSGPGSGDDDPPEPDADNSGPGSTSSGSGSSGSVSGSGSSDSGSSGSGSSGSDDPETDSSGSGSGELEDPEPDELVEPAD